MKKCSIDDLNKLHLFQSINDSTYEKLSNIGIVRVLKKGEHLFRDKDKQKAHDEEMEKREALLKFKKEMRKYL